MKDGKRLLVVSNRLPVTIRNSGKTIDVEPSSGGLVTALLPAFRLYGGCWIGWPGTDHDPEVTRVLRTECAPDCSFEPVFLNEFEEECFYHGCSNEILWPLFHDLPSRCNFDPEFWTAYRDVNEKFAQTVSAVAAHDSFVWVHDYHLMLLADALRARGVRARLAYFHHVPFPPPDVFEKLPWRQEILRALLRFNSVGFQTVRDRRNFIACARRFLNGTRVRRAGSRFLVQSEGQCVAAATFPISIDYAAFASGAGSPEVAARSVEIREQFQGKKLVLGIDRLDYTKGLLERLTGFAALLAARPDLHGKVTLLQVVIPSRECIDNYRQLKDAIEQLVSRINGEYGRPGWTPVEYEHRSIDRTELLALYRAADVALITPIRDGMNLVAKEFCASRIEDDGVLVLSEFAGCAEELQCGALLVNPYDSEGMGAALMKAFRMDPGEQRARMVRMRQAVRDADVFQWCNAIWREAGFRTERHAGAVYEFPTATPLERAIPRHA